MRVKLSVNSNNKYSVPTISSMRSGIDSDESFDMSSPVNPMEVDETKICGKAYK